MVGLKLFSGAAALIIFTTLFAAGVAAVTGAPLFSTISLGGGLAFTVAFWLITKG